MGSFPAPLPPGKRRAGPAQGEQEQQSHSQGAGRAGHLAISPLSAPLRCPSRSADTPPAARLLAIPKLLLPPATFRRRPAYWVAAGLGSVLDRERRCRSPLATELSMGVPVSALAPVAPRNATGGATRERFLEVFPFFRRAPQTLVEDILSSSRQTTLQANMLVQLEADRCHDFIFMLSGETRIFKIGGSGREITLYEIEPGEICVLNASCILANARLPANAATVCETEVLLLPARHFLDMMARHAEMRTFVHSRISTSLASVMALLSEIAFGRMDERLKAYLIEKSENGTVRRTHQQIANDLGTAREVVSRLLKSFERKGLAFLSRNCIELGTL